MEIYDGFNDWNDVQTKFNCEEPEPEQVLVAVYESGGYEGSSIVCYRNGDKYFINEGSHCSCYGLEDQWGPTEYDKDTFLKTLKMRDHYDRDIQRQIDNLIETIEGTYEPPR